MAADFGVELADHQLAVSTAVIGVLEQHTDQAAEPVAALVASKPVAGAAPRMTELVLAPLVADNPQELVDTAVEPVRKPAAAVRVQ